MRSLESDLHISQQQAEELETSYESRIEVMRQHNEAMEQKQQGIVDAHAAELANAKLQLAGADEVMSCAVCVRARASLLYSFTLHPTNLLSCVHNPRRVCVSPACAPRSSRSG